MACGLNLCVIEGLPRALLTGLHHVATSSASVWICVRAKGTHQRAALCYVVISL